MHPDVDCRNRQERLKACGNALPADDPAPILLLEPGKGSLRLEPWHHILNTDIEQPLTERNLINLAHILPKQAQDVDLHLVETFNEVVKLTLYAHPHPMNSFEQLEYPS
jgi:hypothetical protein